MKASVPGTPQAREAVIANSLPETAAIKISEAKLPTPKYDGPPQLQPIEGTPLFYVVNSPIPVIQVRAGPVLRASERGVVRRRVAPGAVEGGDDRAAGHLLDPAELVAPLRHLRSCLPSHAPGGRTSATRRATTASYVSDGVGRLRHRLLPTRRATRTVWYGAARHLRLRDRPDLHAVDGLGHGVRFRLRLRGRDGRLLGVVLLPVVGAPITTAATSYGRLVGPYGGAAAWGPGGWAATTGNVYSRWGDDGGGHPPLGRLQRVDWERLGRRRGHVLQLAHRHRRGWAARESSATRTPGIYAYGARGAAVNPRTGQAVSAGRATTGNVYSGQSGSAGYVRGESGGVARVGNDVYANRDGTVYRNTGGGWQQNSGSGWGGVSEPASHAVAQQRGAGPLERPRRVNNYQSAGGARTGGGGSRGGGGGRRR